MNDKQIPVKIKIRKGKSTEIIGFSFAMACFYFGFDAHKLCNYTFKEV